MNSAVLKFSGAKLSLKLFTQLDQPLQNMKELTNVLVPMINGLKFTIKVLLTSMITLSSTASPWPPPWSTPSSNVYQSQCVLHSSLTRCRLPSSTSSLRSSPQWQKPTTTIHWTLMTTSPFLILQLNKSTWITLPERTITPKL